MLKIIEYSNSQEYPVTPDVGEYDKHKMTKPVYDVIIGCIGDRNCSGFLNTANHN